MHVKKITVVSAGTLMLLTNITPISAKEVSSISADSVKEICHDQIQSSSDLIKDCIDGIQIEKSEPVYCQTSEPVTYTYVEEVVEPSYTEDVFTSFDEPVYVETVNEDSYQQALINYNEALAAYEAANQMIETTKDIEVEVVEEIVDEEGNVSEVTKTEIQTVTKMVPAGDVSAAAANLEAAKQELDASQNILNEEEIINEQVSDTPETTYSASGTCGDNVNWTLDDKGNLVISGTGDMYDYDEDETPWGDQIKSVVIEEGVTSIGYNTFEYCDTLTKVTLPEGLTGIYDHAFSYCEKLSTINLPSTLVFIGMQAFYHCDSLTSIVIPDGVTSIDEYTFGFCSKLSKVSLPESLLSIEYNAFKGCTGLKTITIPVGVERIGNYAFDSCTGLTCVSIPGQVEYLGYNIFDGCENITDVFFQGPETNWDEAVQNMYAINASAVIHFNEPLLPFKDVPKNAWYYPTAVECFTTGLINGTSDTTFSPLQEMTRAMVVTILWRMEGQPSTAFNSKFKDVSSKQWYANSISWAVNAGVVHGYGDGTFKPDASVTREQVAVMLANYVTYKGLYKPGTKKLNTFPDGSQVSTYAQAGMKWALTNGVISGNGAGYLNPKKGATRAEGATMLLRMNNWLDSHDQVIVAKKKGIVGFVEWMVNKGYASTTEDAGVIAKLNDNLSKYNQDASSIRSPFNLNNVEKSIHSIKECNDLRAIHGLSPLRISNYMMLVAAIQNCATWDLHEEGNWGHSHLYNVGENIAYNYDDPFDGWYYNEKAIADEGGTSGIGHYLNIIKPDYTLTGFAWGFMQNSNQVFLYETNTGTTFTPDQYLNLLNQYRNEIGV